MSAGTKTKAKILDAAKSIFLEQGISELLRRGEARRAQVNFTLVYCQFGGKSA